MSGSHPHGGEFMSARHLLVVHADPVLHRKARRAFEGRAVRVHSARTIEDVDGLLHHGLDVLLLSTSLPDGSGYELARKLRERFPASLVVFLASAFEVYDSEKGAAAGADTVLRAPMISGDILSVVESFLGPLSSQKPVPAMAAVEWSLDAPAAEEKIAKFLPRGGKEGDVLAKWAEGGIAVSPDLEASILQAVPQVVEAAIRSAFQSSPAFRQMVVEAVREAVEFEKTEALKKEGP